jgi:2'-5' RNA ligase
MTDAHPPLRLFFALWPDAATRTALTRLQAPLHGRPTAPPNLHLTMAFLGMQPAQVLPALHGVLDDIRLPEMTLRIDRLGYFSRARIAWAGMRHPPPSLLELHADLTAALRHCGIGHDKEYGFRPHITLARNAGAAPSCADDAVIDPIAWRAPPLALVHSTTTPRGPVYKVLAQREPA